MGTRIGPYAIVAVAHDRALTTVYRARDIGVERDVAVKATRAGLDPLRRAEARRRLHVEACLRAAVQHPAVLALHQFVGGDAGPLLVGPWVDGGTLADVTSGPCHMSLVLALADWVGGALDALHATGWWHGDLGATNVLLGQAGDSPHPYVADFGTARRIGAPAVPDSVLVMTPAVTAPEVWNGGGGPASDFYSLGALLYLAFTGTYPFTGDETEHYRDQHLRAPVIPPSVRAAGPGPATDAVLLGALAKDPATRFASGRALAIALGDALAADGLLRARPHVPTPPVALTSTPAFDPDAMRSAGARLEQFADTLDDHERTALSAILALARTQGARAAEHLGQLAMQVFGPAGALLALDETGAAGVLAAGPAHAADVAAACGAPEWALERVLALLASTGVLERDGDGRYVLAPMLAALYQSHLALGSDAQPIADAAALWGQLPHWAATGEPALTMDDPDDTTYTQVTPCLGAMFAPDAARLASILTTTARVPRDARVLDIGAGSAVWSLAIVAAVPGAHTTALDRPLVLENAHAHAAAAGLADRLDTVPGDWRDTPIADAAYDLVILANVCHLEAGDDVARLLARVAGALKPGGIVVIVDTIPERIEDDPAALLQSIHLGLRTRRGGVHDRASYARWLNAARLESGELVLLREHLAALVALRPRDQASPN